MPGSCGHVKSTTVAHINSEKIEPNILLGVWTIFHADIGQTLRAVRVCAQVNSSIYLIKNLSPGAWALRPVKLVGLLEVVGLVGLVGLF